MNDYMDFCFLSKIILGFNLLEEGVSFRNYVYEISYKCLVCDIVYFYRVYFRYILIL